MEIIIRGKQGGKTTDVIKFAAENGLYIVAKDKEECVRISDIAKNELKLNINFPISFNEFVNRNYYGKRIKGFVVDDADLLIQYLSNVKINCISITDHELNNNNKSREEFLSRLSKLLKEYNASIGFDCDSPSDLHGVTGEGVILSINDKVIQKFDYEWDINYQDIDKRI